MYWGTINQIYCKMGHKVLKQKTHNTPASRKQGSQSYNWSWVIKRFSSVKFGLSAITVLSFCSAGIKFIKHWWHSKLFTCEDNVRQRVSKNSFSFNTHIYTSSCQQQNWMKTWPALQMVEWNTALPGDLSLSSWLEESSVTENPLCSPCAKTRPSAVVRALFLHSIREDSKNK